MRSRQVLKETFNKIPKPESALQNQWLLLEVLCDIRDLLQEQHDIPDVKGEKFIAPWENLKHSSEPANEEKDDSTVAPFDDDEPEQKILKPAKPIDEPI